MSELFLIYQDQFLSTTSQLTKLIEGIKTSQTKEEKDKLCSDIDKYIRESERIIKQMDLEVSLSFGLSQKTVTNHKTQLNNCKTELQQMIKKYKQEKENFELNQKQEKLIISSKNTDR